MLASVDDNVLETNVYPQSMAAKTEEDEVHKMQKVLLHQFSR